MRKLTEAGDVIGEGLSTAGADVLCFTSAIVDPVEIDGRQALETCNRQSSRTLILLFCGLSNVEGSAYLMGWTGAPA